MKKRYETVLTALAVVLSLLMPLAASLTAEALTDGREWTAESPAERRFAGTMENRVSALCAYGNASPHIRLGGKEEASVPDGLWEDLARAGLLPFPRGEQTARAERFWLTPAQYEARFEYMKTICAAGEQTLTVIQDAESGGILRLEFTGTLENWTADSHEMLNRYLTFQGYESSAEGIWTGGENGALAMERALIPQTYLEASALLSPSAGLIICQLSPAAG